MGKTGAITMTTRELDRLQIIQAVVDGNLKPGRAAERLAMTNCQVRWLFATLSAIRTFIWQMSVGKLQKGENLRCRSWLPE